MTQQTNGTGFNVYRLHWLDQSHDYWTQKKALQALDSKRSASNPASIEVLYIEGTYENPTLVKTLQWID